MESRQPEHNSDGSCVSLYTHHKTNAMKTAAMIEIKNTYRTTNECRRHDFQELNPSDEEAPFKCLTLKRTT